MEALKQYIDLYTGNADVISANSAPAINALRDDACRRLLNSRFPDKRDEGFQKTSINDMFAPDYGVNINRVNIPVDIAASFKCDIPNVSTLLSIVVNDRFVATRSLLNNLPDGVTVTSLAAAAKENPELVSRYYGRIAPADNVNVALNNMLVQDGVFIHIRKGVTLEKPLQLVNIFSSPTPTLAFRRILIVAEENSRVNILACDHTQSENIPFLSSEVVEIALGNNAAVGFYSIEESSPDTSRYSQMFVTQQTGSDFTSATATLLNGSTRNDFNVTLNGEHARTMLAGMVIADKKSHVDNNSNVIHAAPHCHSNQLFKYLLDGNSNGAFEGSIVVTPEAPFTEGYQSNHNILASDSAKMHTRPQLLIFNDEVKCSHGATTGQLDQNALFYMQTRGIPQQQAKRLLMQAFMSDAIDSIRVEPIRDRLRHLVERRLAGDELLCAECNSECHK
ncbi:MAG: Fe-S cluster assembly protein SufD [Muribaculaceae bacterium]|nr:Fe-S cluster assembly protein SufD [Muribaculaceae bacterium]